VRAERRNGDTMMRSVMHYAYAKDEPREKEREREREKVAN